MVVKLHLESMVNESTLHLESRVNGWSRVNGSLLHLGSIVNDSALHLGSRVNGKHYI
jgi:hypothetical protein